MLEQSKPLWLRALRVVGTSAASIIVLGAVIVVLTLPTKTQGNIPNPLAPPATDSPRSTFLAYHSAVKEAQRIIQSAYDTHINEPGWFQSEETRAKVRTAQAYLARAVRTFDSSEVPPNARARTLLEVALQLDEVLERVRVPVADEIPDAETVRRRAERGERPNWVVPNTEIRIARIESGPRTGEYLFTADTVARMYEFYSRVRDLPGEDRFDFYSFYAFSPGELMPPKWYGYIERLPDWFRVAYHDNARWQWFGLAATLLFVLLTALAAYHWTWRDRAASRLPAPVRACTLPLAIMLSISLAALIVEELNVTGPARRHAVTALELVWYAASAWLIFAAANQIGHRAATSWAARKQSFDAGIVRVAISVIGLALAVGTLVYGANQVGVPLVGILAGLGVGGLAVALAAQPTLENFIGGIMIYADRPVRVGDECKFGDMKGVVEEIGIRSTRLRADDRSLVSIPNAEFSKLRLTNFSRRDRPQFKTRIGIRYGLDPAQLKAVLDGMRGALKTHWAALPDTVHVYCAEFGKEAIEIDVSAQMPEDAKLQEAATREDLLLRLFNAIEQSGATLTARA